MFPGLIYREGDLLIWIEKNPSIWAHFAQPVDKNKSNCIRYYSNFARRTKTIKFIQNNLPWYNL